MFEIILGLVAVGTVAKVADNENLSGIVWGALTFAVCFLCIMLVPLPFLRILMGGAAVFVVMWAYKMKKGV